MQNRRFAGLLTCDPGCHCPVKHVAPCRDRRSKCVRPSPIGGPRGVFPTPPQPDLKIRGGVRTSQQLCWGPTMPAALKKATGSLCQHIAWLEHLGSSSVGFFFLFSFFGALQSTQHPVFLAPGVDHVEPGRCQGEQEKNSPYRRRGRVERLACKLSCQQQCLEAESRMGEMGFKPHIPPPQ